MTEVNPAPEPEAGTTEVQRVHLLGLDNVALRKWLELHDEPRYRAEQLVEWIYARRATTFDEITVLPKRLRMWLTEHAALYTSTVARESVALDQTTKLLLQWPDGNTIETVWIPTGESNTACLSSQAGCPVGCAFCASGMDGLQRNLTAGEIVEQAMRVSRLVAATAEEGDERPPRLSNIVMMGMGEPLANYEEVIKAIRIINASWGLNIGARKITVSTVGLPQQIRRLAAEELQLNLALSLHAPDEELRRELIPWGKIPLNEIL
ncbi:MAG: 23S rRNA (adenine(2503)-C(2))-methyltransferase RlmN, partial [Phycisphaerae bacterium]|nr:23S rRNA (adenine(2503)-C(2))-methyltransferase RlmN [Phycisphaerae bacterium]